MLGYHLFIAWKSIRRTPRHSLLIVVGLALGVAVATLFSTIHHTYAKDPVPGKSGMLHLVRMDSWDPKQAHPDGIPPQITYRDMIEIMKSDIPTRQTGSFRGVLRVYPPEKPERNRFALVRLCHADFFAMFDIPFQYGSAWDHAADERAERVVVLHPEMNKRLFGGGNSVGKVVNIDGREFRVIGVIADWYPSLRFYDITQTPTLLIEWVFIPLSHVRPMEIKPFAPAWSWKPPAGPSYEAMLAGERTFLQMWVELSGPAEVSAYKSFLDAYALEQRRSGRFLRPLDNRVTPLLDYMKEKKVTPPEATATMIAGNLFLLACSLTLMSLLLSRFLGRSAEIGVRRALGASRWDIFLQHVAESEVLAFVGGLLGLGVASAALGLANGFFKTMSPHMRDDIFRMDLDMAWFSVFASLAAGLIAGLYPAYRVCRVAPAFHLRSQ